MSQLTGKINLDLLTGGVRKRPLIQNVRKLVMAPCGLIWLSLCIQFPCIPSPAQQPPVIPAPRQETPPLVVPQLLSEGTITGTVIDQTGAVVVGAQVRLTRADRSAFQEVRSDGNGQFLFSNMVPGFFQLTITAPGFATQTFTGSLRSGEFYSVPASPLAPAALQTEIQVTASPIEVAQAEINAQEKQRVLGVIPNFFVSYIPDAAPLTSRQKFELARKSIIDPATFAITGFIAGMQQARNDYPGYGQGAAGYAKRFGAAYADNATSTLIGGAILPSLFKQDPRYFYNGTGSVRSRFLHAIAQSVICKGDNQHWEPNYSRILGSVISGAVANLYHPDKDRGADLLFENVLVGTGETAVVNLFQEFVIRQFTTHVPKRKQLHP